jgi:hypothetical protein
LNIEGSDHQSSYRQSAAAKIYVYSDDMGNGLYTIKGAPLLKNLEGDPRYKAFLRRMNLPE